MIFDEVGIIWGPVLGLHEVVADPQAEALDLFPEIDHPEIGAYRTVSSPMRFHTSEVGPSAPAPAIGAHTREVLLEAGFDDDRIDTLLADGVIGES